MSEAQKEQLEEILTAIFEEFVASVAEARGKTREVCLCVCVWGGGGHQGGRNQGGIQSGVRVCGGGGEGHQCACVWRGGGGVTSVCVFVQGGGGRVQSGVVSMLSCSSTTIGCRFVTNPPWPAAAGGLDESPLLMSH